MPALELSSPRNDICGRKQIFKKGRACYLFTKLNEQQQYVVKFSLKYLEAANPDRNMIIVEVEDEWQCSKGFSPAVYTLPSRLEPAWQNMAQYPLNGTKQPVAIKEEVQSPTTDRQWVKKQ